MERSGNIWQSIIIFLILLSLIVYALYPYVNSFLGAFILYVMLKPLYFFLTIRFNITSNISALLTIVVSFLIILIPMFVLLNFAILQIPGMFQDLTWVYYYIESLAPYIEKIIRTTLPMENATYIQSNIDNAFIDIMAYTVDSVVSLTMIFSNLIIELIIMYLVLFYLLVGGNSNFARDLQNAIPFNKDNTDRLLSQFSSFVKAIMLSSGIIAILHGVILTLTFILLGIENAFFWGSITMILAFLPAVGPPIIWVPTVILQLLQGNVTIAIGALIGGIVHIFIEQFLRPIVQKKVGRINPLMTVVGLVAGLNLFGLIGIIIGPLLISYIILVSSMIHDEYLSVQD